DHETVKSTVASSTAGCHARAVSETRIIAAEEDDMKPAVAAAVEILEQGGIVALPTETVYGLAADALDPQAVAKVFAAKERPSFDPLIVHISGISDLQRVAEVPPEIADH